MNYKEELDNIEQQINKNKEENIRLEEQLRQANEEKKELLALLTVEDVTEENLDDTIMDLEQDLQQGISECKSLLEN